MSPNGEGKAITYYGKRFLTFSYVELDYTIIVLRVSIGNSGHHPFDGICVVFGLEYGFLSHGSYPSMGVELLVSSIVGAVYYFLGD